MKIVIKNIGKVRDASICIDGITVIGGKNGTGRERGRMEGYLPEGLLPGAGSVTYRQLSLFDDVNFGPKKEERAVRTQQAPALLRAGG